MVQVALRRVRRRNRQNIVGKLDARKGTPRMAVKTAAGYTPAANGPDGRPLDWHSIDWAQHEANVRRLRQRIFAASQAGDLAKVRNLQKLMLRSHSNTLVSVKRVSQLSSGRKTAGIDRELALTPEERSKLAREVHRVRVWKAKPVKRVYILKANGKTRPLGIPVIRDRVLQARVKNALEPEWEARFEEKSYGFRPGRSAHDAIEAIYQIVVRSSAKRLWVLDADLSAAFDRINHDHLMEAVGDFPARGLIRQWLRAGVVEEGRFFRTDEGTPQGGVISPLLMNVALHGMEEAAGVRRKPPLKTGRKAGLREIRPGSPVLVRYADDFVVFTETEADALAAKERLSEWLEPRGLSINEDKTRVVHLHEGFDFLGFNVRRYRTPDGDKTLIKPSRDAIQRIKGRLSAEVRDLHGHSTMDVLKRLNPIIRGWSAYYRHAVSKDVFASLDNHVFWLMRAWSRRQHRNKGTGWINNHYWHTFRQGTAQELFGDRVTGAYLYQFAFTPIVRHVSVKGGASPDDPALKEYWDTRRRKRTPPPMDKRSLSLASAQKGICPLCKQWLIPDAEFEPDNVRKWIAWFDASRKRLHVHHFLVYRQHGGGDERRNLRLVHTECHKAHHALHPEGVEGRKQ